MRILACLTMGIGLGALLLGLLITGSSIASPGVQTCNVPGEYNTIQSAVGNPDCAVIDIGDGTFVENVNVTRTVTMQGQGINQTTIDGDDKAPVFTIDPGLEVKIALMTVTGGQYEQGGVFLGSGIHNIGSKVVLSNTAVVSNTHKNVMVGEISDGIYNGSGGTLRFLNSTIIGQISNDGMLVVENSQIKENSELEGNAISNRNSGSATFYNSTFEGVRSHVIGNSGILTVTSSTFEDIGYSQGGVIAIANSGTAILDDLTLVGTKGHRGTISNSGTMTITNSLLDENQSGIVHHWGSLTVSNCIISGTENSARGAIYTDGFGTVLVENSTLSDNDTYNNGGGLMIAPSQDITVTIRNSTISNNHATNGGGIGVDFTQEMVGQVEIKIINSTITGNSADFFGGAIWIHGHAELENVTLYQNEAPIGSGIFVGSDPSSIAISNSIIVNSGQGSDCQVGSNNAFNSQGNNIDGDGSCDLSMPGDLSNTDPMLAPLQDNGGPTLTHALSSVSPAVDAGNDANCPAKDQRGILRPFDGDGDGVATCDIGAYEYDGPLPLRCYLPAILGN